ncbi:hypothetical protein LZ198_36475 [Myxococcus sp. K15C18031901]|uniref:hypothetical protein n=1 Tax=Myxococcus dinghuensis TaxID=2906761 RepID=UPI0020A7E91A|nr:hypothetical protein [Myxococcus dinghuensis]MCP3104375.1 hypothetical protein [Myxococcus dinghuensis]
MAERSDTAPRLAWLRTLAGRMKAWARSVFSEEESDFAAALAESRFVTGPVKAPPLEPRPATPVSLTAPCIVSPPPASWSRDAQARGGAAPPVDWGARVRKVAPHLVGDGPARPDVRGAARGPDAASTSRGPSPLACRPIAARPASRGRRDGLPAVSPRRISPPGRVLGDVWVPPGRMTPSWPIGAVPDSSALASSKAASIDGPPRRAVAKAPPPAAQGPEPVPQVGGSAAPKEESASERMSPSEVCAPPLDDATRELVSSLAVLPRGLSVTQAIVERRQELGRKILTTLGIVTLPTSELPPSAQERVHGPVSTLPPPMVAPTPSSAAAVDQGAEPPDVAPGWPAPSVAPRPLYIPPPTRTLFPELEEVAALSSGDGGMGLWPESPRPTSDEVRDMAMEIQLWERQRRLEREQRGE